MKKTPAGFRAVMLLPVSAAAAGIALTSAGMAFVGIILGVGGAAAAGWWYLYFIRLDYYDDGIEILIRSGVIIRKTKRMLKNDILWTNRIRLFGSPVLTVLHTGGGSVVIFAEPMITDNQLVLY